MTRDEVYGPGHDDLEHDAGLPADDHGDLAPRRARCTPTSECVTWTETGAAARDLRRGRRQRGPARERARAARRRDRRPGRHVLLEHAGAPRGVPRGPVDGRGAAHAEHPAVPRAAHLRHQPRRRPGRSSSTTRSSRCSPRSSAELDDGRALRRRRRRRRVARSATDDRCSRYARAARRRVDRASSGPRSTNGRPRRCVTRRARPATRRASSTRTARRTCTRSRRPRRPRSDLSERDRILTIVPMFHANAWGIPYAAFICGASLVMPGRFLQAEPLTHDDRRRSASRSRARCRRSGPTSCATARSTRSTCRRSA